MPVFNNVLAGAAGSGGSDYEIERSLRFSDDDSASLIKTFSSAGDRKKFTISLWVKRGKLGKSYQPFISNTNSSGTEGLYFDFSSDYLHFGEYATNGWRWQLQSAGQYRDCSAWYSIVASVDTTQATESARVKLYINGEQITTFYSGLNTYPSQNLDIQFNNTSLHAIGRLGANTSTSYHFDGLMAEFHFVDGAALSASDFGEIHADTGVWSPIKYAGSHNVGSGVNGFYLDFSDTSSNAALGYDAAGSNNWNVNNISAKSNGWPEAVYAGDATYNINETSKAFYTGTGADLFDGTTNNYVGGQNASNSWLYFRPTTAITGVTSIELYGAYNGGGTKVNGSDVSVSPSWTTLDQWVSISNPPSSISSIAVKGTSGAAARLKAIKVNGTILTDVPASDIDSLLDSPTNYEASSGNNGGNYCTWNPLVVTTNNSLSNGNLEASHTASTGWTGNTGASGYPMFVGNMGVTSGKYYWEGSFTSATVGAIGVVNKPQGHLYYVGYADTTAKSAGYSTTYVYNNGFGAAVGSLPAITQNDIIGVAIDMDNGKLYFSLNGTFINSGDPIAGTGFVASGLDGETIFPAISHLGSNDGYSFTANFGARPFVYTPPTGFKSLCTTNLDDPLIADGSDYFDVKTWDGTGAENTLTGFEFSPDMIWVKRRNNSTDWHNITDTVRGATNTLYPNDQYVDTVSSQNVKAFTSDGVTLGTFGGVNASGGTYVGWTWDAGNSNTTISAGSLNSSAYNTSQDWYTAGTETGTWASSYDWQGVFESSDITTTSASECMATSSTTKFTFGTAVAASSNVTILSYQNVTATFKVNAGETDETSIAVPTNTGVSEHVITFNGDVKNIQIESSGQYVYVTGVKIDGKLLVQPSGTMVNVPAFASTVRANQTAGFSIVSYTGNNTTGATVAHGLNTTPSWIIIKNRSTAYNWIVLYTDTSKKLYLDLTNTPDAYSQTTRNSSYFTLENGTAVNGSGDDMIAYCFAPVEGYSAFGSYTGNGSADGPFVYTGFKPAFLMLKRTDGAAGWYIYDYKRDGYNAANKLLYANVTNAEANNHIPDFLSNGFQIKTTGTVANGNGNSYIYAAFAENPFKTARAR